LLANSSDTEQTDFFKAFVRKLETWETHFSREMQGCQVAKALTSREKDLLRCFVND